MSSVDALKRRVTSLARRLPRPDIEFEVLALDEEPAPGENVIVIDIVGSARALVDDSLEETDQ